MKKILVIVPVLALLAAGCGSSAPSSSNSQSNPPVQTEQSSGTNSNQANTPPSMPEQSGSSMGNATSSMSGMDMNGSSMWQGTLQLSNNGAKGQYMLSTGGHTIYLNTSRDYSALVGKPVNVSYSGTLDSFTLGDITAQ